MSSQGTFTKRLLSLRDVGAVIKCARKDFEGEEMIYSPREKFDGYIIGDPRGWVLKSDPNGRRFTGGDCYACY